MKFLLFPFSLIYGTVVLIRNLLFDRGVFKQRMFDFPVIGIGNLRVGGTGKTPMADYLIQMLQAKRHHPAVISRGYGRSTSGFLEVDAKGDVRQFGDEPFLLKGKHPETKVIVDENRARAIDQLRVSNHDVDVVLLDDAMQHRWVKPGLLIMLSSYRNFYLDDYVLPVGRLREPAIGSNRADVIVITKCPPKLDIHTRRSMRDRIRPMHHQTLFFAYEKYDNAHSLWSKKELVLEELWKKKILLVTGLATPDHLEEYLADQGELVEHLKFGDHHWYTESDLLRIQQSYLAILGESKVIITTEKDAQRLRKWKENEKFAGLPIFVLKHATAFFQEDAEVFEKRIDEFIRSYH